MIITGRRLPRRTFLRGLGTAIALPALDAMTPAFAAPAGPMATVATGMPFGICTVDKRESSPFSALVTGTPMTGRVVILAIMPGRCAAPPAPAMMTRRPRP